MICCNNPILSGALRPLSHTSSRQRFPLAVAMRSVGTKPHKHAPRKSRWDVIPKWTKPPKPKLRKPYQATALIVDLIDERKNLTRDYNEQDDSEQRKIWSQTPAASAILQRASEFKHEVKLSRAHWKRKLFQFDHRQLTERDIFSVAFLGVVSDDLLPQQTPALPRARDDLNFGSLDITFLRSIGVWDRIAEDTPLAVQVLLRRLESQHELQLEPNVQQEANQDSEKALMKTNQNFKKLLSTAGFQQTQRLIVPLLQTDEGRIIVSRCADEVVTACTRHERLLEDEKNAIKVLVFLKNVSYNLKTRNFSFDLMSNPAVQVLEGRFTKGWTDRHLGTCT
ncbi:hypothetical protein B0H67DRAFT_280848 [Lasiosphaeris hirsuta]|uniref:Uncharacterized protein n=1 Tax=Lasiosphaeris hirsuta TaxID=260670 RepID=A0AA40DRZ3_9PEZI|nr:hypothetical protein B0H67DRAFT_280848 [Lasiosphaeris hirsuta]